MTVEITVNESSGPGLKEALRPAFSGVDMMMLVVSAPLVADPSDRERWWTPLAGPALVLITSLSPIPSGARRSIVQMPPTRSHNAWLGIGTAHRVSVRAPADAVAVAADGVRVPVRWSVTVSIRPHGYQAGDFVVRVWPVPQPDFVG